MYPIDEEHVQTGFFGAWRSLVARPSGGRKVAGSSPAVPTNFRFHPSDATVSNCSKRGVAQPGQRAGFGYRRS